MTRIRPVLPVLLLLGLAGCGSTPVEDRYYSLVLAADESGTSGPLSAGSTHLVVGPVLLPEFLQRRGIAMQTGTSQIRTANHHFWAEPLDEAIAKVLVRDLARLNSNLVVDRDAGRWTEAGDCRVRIEFDSFQASSAARVVTSGRFWIVSGEITQRREFAVTKNLSADGYAHSVDVLRNALNDVAMQISRQIAGDAVCAD